MGPEAVSGPEMVQRFTGLKKSGISGIEERGM